MKQIDPLTVDDFEHAYAMLRVYARVKEIRFVPNLNHIVGDIAFRVKIINSQGEPIDESPDYETLGKFWLSLGQKWDPSDIYHFEYEMKGG